MERTAQWEKELESGIYIERLLPGGFIKPGEEIPGIDGLDFYIDAFRELSSCRPGGMSLQAIPFTAIAEYSRIYELDDFEDFAYIIRRMDNAFMKLSEASTKKVSDNAPSTAGTKDNSNR